MSKLTDALNRLIIFLTGLLATGAGALVVALYFDIPVAQRFVDNMHPREWDTIPQSPLFLFTVGAVGVFALLFGALGLYMNLKRYHIRRVSSPASTPTGAIDYDLSAVAGAVADSFEALPRVIRAHSVARWERGVRIITITVDAEPHVNLRTLEEHAVTTEQDLRQALRETLDVVFRFHIAPVERKN
ncbi:hypothetical protein [Corynebacterium hindlerae]|uniref:hypothetical protein n=1 Tax=Corynebacterium hindlerae TaxID=699041 RepID=UPI003AAA59DD